MEPTLSDGDFVVAATRLWRPRPGRLIVAPHPDYGVLVKRLQRISSEGFTLSSDNPLGIDSHSLGKIPKDQVIGPVLMKIRRRNSVTRSPEKQTKAAPP
jgi:phage repressor protein C with HTH and peptisase S24 domain